MIVNDIASLGTVPVVVGPLITAGSSSWFADEARSHDVIWGWKNSCDLARCAYGPGESAALSGLVAEGAAALSGFGLAIDLRQTSVEAFSGPIAGDAIVLLESSGIHANGLTNARKVASILRNGYQTEIETGLMFGDALLRPTTIYSPVVEDCIRGGHTLHYAVHITGHGFRKLMRFPGDLTYVIDELPETPDVLRFICEELRIAAADAYGTFNMGAGYAIFVGTEDANGVMQVAGRHGISSMIAGHVEGSPGQRRVRINPIDVTFERDSLKVR